MSDAPIGLEASSGGDATDQPLDPSAEPAPTPLEVAEDTLIQIKGQPKPVKFGEYGKGFQSQFTKASQRAAQLERELQTERQQRQQYEQERQRQSQQQSQPGQPDVFDALKQLPYLTGQDAAQVVQQIGSAFQQRDQVILAALKKIQQMEQLLGGLNENHTSQQFEGKISKMLTEGGFPPEAADLAKEIYLAYEGDDLDSEFPRIFAERWAQVQKILETMRQQKVASARRSPFVPGKGGQGNPSKPLDIKANASAREVAEQLWGTWSGSDT